MTVNKTERSIKTEGIGARFIGRQLHKFATTFAAFIDCPRNHLSAYATTAYTTCNTHALDLPAPHALARKAGNEAEL
ncbi:MAG: hypothetical protein E5299_02443 [Burkholderia gladioli]|nr:MAG: hypothetical protein E5299_02443 [Burkholderia gladioli]